MDKISEEDAIRIDAEFASKADDKFDASKLKVQCIDESRYYIITFFLSINGHRVQGSYRIEVGYEGNVLYYSGSPNPQYDIDISGIDFDLIIELAKAKLDEYYQDSSFKVFEFPEAESLYVGVLGDGRLTVSFSVIAKKYGATEVTDLLVICPRNNISNQSQIETTS
jgi:hypothetical protein